jgi:hypothetical protein
MDASDLIKAPQTPGAKVAIADIDGATGEETAQLAGNEAISQADDISAERRYCALLDWPTCSSSDPIRWRPSADPGQKQDTGDRIMAQRD